MRESEAGFQEKVMQYAALRGWLIHHDRPARARERGTGRDGWRTAISGDAGFPDLVLARHGRVVFAELKSDIGKPTPAQARWADHLGYDLGFESTFDYYLWKPSDWIDIERILK